MATHVVVKPFSGSGETEFRPGQLVDATGWPNVGALVRTRYLRERTVAEAAQEQQKTRPGRGKG